MARVPVIDSPCPIAGKRIPSGTNEHCATCDRTVHNLNRMSEGQRQEFMRGCQGKVCVAYTVRVPLRRRALTAATLAVAALVSLPAAADAPGPAPAPAETPATTAPAPAPSAASDVANSDEFGDMEIMGGVLDAEDAQWVDDGKDAPPELPAVEDDGK